MKRLAIAILALAFMPGTHAQDERQFPDASETTPELIQLWQDANSTCRGASGNDVRTWAACASRAVYGAALNERDWCFGKENDAGAEMEWHECETDSLRFAPIDVTQF